MPLSPAEWLNLQRWSFATDYKHHLHYFVAMARSAYLRGQKSVNVPLQPVDLVGVMEASLTIEPLFDKILNAKSFLQQRHHPIVRNLMARKILHDNWHMISLPTP